VAALLFINVNVEIARERRTTPAARHVELVQGPLFLFAPRMSAFGGKADMAFCTANVR
jgi:hypothetical protein